MHKFDGDEITYYRSREFTALLNGQNIPFCSKPGLPHWDRVSPAASLLASGVELGVENSYKRILVLGCGHGAAAAALARSAPKVEFLLCDNNWIALRMADETLKVNRLLNAHVFSGISILPQQAGSLDLVVMDLPKGRQLARRWLVEAYHALRPGGRLYLAGSNDEGIQPVIKDASMLFGPAAILQYKKGSRLARLSRLTNNPGQPPEWAEAPGIAPGSWIEFDVDLQNERLRLRGLPGVFSVGELDEGTRLLIENVDKQTGRSVLDVGCGYGVIGLWAARSGARSIRLVDSNLLAIASAQENLARFGYDPSSAVPGDALDTVADRPYDAILTNPPFHAGKGVDTTVTAAIITAARRALNPGGSLWLVANRFLRYEEWLRPQFETVRRTAETGKFIVWQAIP